MTYSPAMTMFEGNIGAKGLLSLAYAGDMHLKALLLKDYSSLGLLEVFIKSDCNYWYDLIKGILE